MGQRARSRPIALGVDTVLMFSQRKQRPGVGPMNDDTSSTTSFFRLPSGARLGFDRRRRLVEIRVPPAPDSDAFQRRRAAISEAEQHVGHALRISFWVVDRETGEFVLAEPRMTEPRGSWAVAANTNGAASS